MYFHDEKYHLLQDYEVIERPRRCSHLFWQYFAGVIVGVTLSLSLHCSLLMPFTNDSFVDSSPFESKFIQANSFISHSIHYRSASNLQRCSDGITRGYSNWSSLRNAIQETNIYSASLATIGSTNWMIDDFGIAMPSEPLPSPETFVICPGAYLKDSSRYGPIFIDSENVKIDCDSCIIDVSSSHFTFGKNAKGVVIKGITFINARSSSLTFYHDGADVSFEDCHWENNAGLGNAGAVADLNSTRYEFVSDQCRYIQFKQCKKDNLTFNVLLFLCSAFTVLCLSSDAEFPTQNSYQKFLAKASLALCHRLLFENREL